eukprot:g2969.t1
MNASFCIFLDAIVSNGEWGRLRERRRAIYARVVFMKGQLDSESVEGVGDVEGEGKVVMPRTALSAVHEGAIVSEWTSMHCDVDHRRAVRLVIGQTARVSTGPSHSLEMDMTSHRGVSFIVEIYGALSTGENLQGGREKLLGTTQILHSQNLDVKVRDSRPTAFDLQGLSVDADLRHQTPLFSGTGLSRGHLNFSVWVEPIVDFEEDSFSDPDALRRAVLSTADLTLVVVAKRAFDLAQPDMFRKPWPFISLELQLQDPEIADERAAAAARAEEEAKTDKRKAKALAKSKNSKKKANTRKDTMWPKISEWESYEIDSTCSPEWDDRTEFRLMDIGHQRGMGKNANLIDKATRSSRPMERLKLTANEKHAHVRIDIRVMDRDKDKARKLARLEAPISIRDLPIHSDPSPSVNIGDSNASATEDEPKRKTSRALLSSASRSSKNIDQKSSEREYELFSKGKPGAGTLCLDMWLRPSEAMLSAGNMVMDLFGVANALLESPLKDRWTADVYRTNSNKVSSILRSLEGAMDDWRFAGMLERLPGGGVSRARLDIAKESLVAMKAALAKRVEKEALEKESLEEELQLERQTERESKQNRRRLIIERAKQGGARTRKRLQIDRSDTDQSEFSDLVLGSAHADFVEEYVHGITARVAGNEMPPSQLKTFLLQPQCPDRITMMRWSLTDNSINLLLTWASLPGVSYQNILELDLPENYIEAQGAIMISNCLRGPDGCLVNIEMLNLRYNQIQDKGSRAIAEALKMHRKIRNLCLSMSSLQLVAMGNKSGENIVEGEVVGAEVDVAGVDVAGVDVAGGGTGVCPIGEGAMGAESTGEGAVDANAEFVLEDDTDLESDIRKAETHKPFPEASRIKSTPPLAPEWTTSAAETTADSKLVEEGVSDKRDMVTLSRVLVTVDGLLRKQAQPRTSTVPSKP